MERPSAVFVERLTKISMTVAGVVPVLRNQCCVPFFMKNACPGLAAVAAPFSIVISRVPDTGAQTW